MKKSFIAFIVLSLSLLCGCTQYNGHIGPIFGSWALVDVTEDGSNVSLDDETVFSFQNEVVQVLRLTDAPYEVEARYGNFSISDEYLTLKFQSQPTADGSYKYMVPDWLYFPEDGKPIQFDVRKLNGSEMILSLDSGSKVLVYTFKKTY